jgi:hypothetical protein
MGILKVVASFLGVPYCERCERLCMDGDFTFLYCTGCYKLFCRKCINTETYKCHKCGGNK